MRKKWASAEAKKQALSQEAAWEALKRKYAKPVGPARTAPKPMVINPRIAELRELPSVDTGITGAVTLGESQMYTGTKMIGIGTLHKSNAVPIFTSEEAKDLTTMRR